MIDVSNDGHVTDVPFLVHQSTDFVDGEVDLLEPDIWKEQRKNVYIIYHFNLYKISQYHEIIKIIS